MIVSYMISLMCDIHRKGYFIVSYTKINLSQNIFFYEIISHVKKMQNVLNSKFNKISFKLAIRANNRRLILPIYRRIY